MTRRTFAIRYSDPLVLSAIVAFAGTAILSLSLVGRPMGNVIRSPLYSSGPSRTPSPLEVSPDQTSLGVLRKGQQASASFTLTNRGSQTVTIERVGTSCPCMRPSPRSIRIGPAETKVLSIEFDPSEDPDFYGHLSINVTGYAGEDVMFQTVARLEVRGSTEKLED